MQRQITLKNAHKKYVASRGISGGTGTSVIENIEVTSEYPLVSFISMIAPSPDWFLGVRDFNLCNTTTGEWVDSKGRDLPLYDAGTDSGPLFNSSNMATNPAENIFLITNNTEGSLKGDKPLKRFGTFAFVKTSVSPTASPTPTSAAHLVPNLNMALALMFCFLRIFLFWVWMLCFIDANLCRTGWFL